MNDSRRFLLAIGLSVLVFVVWNHFFAPPPPTTQENSGPVAVPTALALPATAEAAAASALKEAAAQEFQNVLMSYFYHQPFDDISRR